MPILAAISDIGFAVAERAISRSDGNDMCDPQDAALGLV